MTDHADHAEDTQDDIIEAYCMTCRETVPIEDPQPVWTRRGSAATRGVCPTCGTTVFRIGHTPAHDTLTRPEPIRVAEKTPGKLPGNVVYINYSVPDAEFAEKLAEDLNRIGVQTYMAEDAVSDVQWATGAHPALVECKRMVVVLTPLAAHASAVIEAWEFFEQQRKPIVVAQLAATELPDALRRKARFDFSGEDYTRSFRELAQALTS